MSCSNNVDVFVKSLESEYKREEWRLFTDASVLRLKVVALHVGKFPPVPVFHASQMKEAYDNMHAI
jgi:hypothetical protein